MMPVLQCPRTPPVQMQGIVFLPDDVPVPAPVVIVLHGFAGSKDDPKNVELAEDEADV
jgi:poly(3-hydroxybutyrate) depolymerase